MRSPGYTLIVVLLLGLGFRELSMAPVFLPRVKLMVRNVTIPLAESIAAQAKELASAAEIRHLVTNASREVWSKSLGQQPK